MFTGCTWYRSETLYTLMRAIFYLAKEIFPSNSVDFFFLSQILKLSSMVKVMMRKRLKFDVKKYTKKDTLRFFTWVALSLYNL